MRKFWVLVLLLLVPFCFGFGRAPQSAPVAENSSNGSSAAYPYLIDNFEDGDFSRAPEWYKFDNVTPVVERTIKYQDGDAVVVSRIGANFLHVTGSCTNWYAGGIGTYLGKDASAFRSLEMDIYGMGPGSGQLKIELYDDDDNNWDTAVDSNWVPTNDDQWVSNINVDWKGWKHVSIPFSSFTLTNPGKGNGVFDPSQTNGSGGLLKLQLIFLGNQQAANINLGIDNLVLGN